MRQFVAVFIVAFCVANMLPSCPEKEREIVDCSIESIVKRESTRVDVRPELVMAMIDVESEGIVESIRFEPNYKHLSSPERSAARLGITVATETALQRMTYGLLHINGGTARWLGFKGPLTNLLHAPTNVRWALKYVAKLKERYRDERDIVAAYNAGSARRDASGRYENQQHVDKVFARLDGRQSSKRGREP